MFFSRCCCLPSRVGSRVLAGAGLPWTPRHRVLPACARPRQLLEVQNATQVYFQQLITTLAPKGKYVWNALSGYVRFLGMRVTTAQLKGLGDVVPV